MYFDSLRRRLIEQVRGAIHAGEVTERGLAVQIGISQPHLHNILKGVRALTPELADRLLGRLHLSVSDLMEDLPVHGHIKADPTRRIPFLQSKSLADARWPVFVSAMYAVPSSLVHGMEQPVVAELPFEAAMSPLILKGDLGLVEAGRVVDAGLAVDGLYVVSAGDSTAVRWVRAGARCLYLSHEQNFDKPAAWLKALLQPSQWRTLLVGRVVSVARPPGYRFQAVSGPRTAN